jgi:hypothetical protein
MKRILYILCSFLCTGVITARDIHISSSNKELEKAFEWAKEKAMSFVMTGKTGPVNVHQRDLKDLKDVKEAAYMPSYWAGYPLRTAFYSRDFCHQISGAHLLGLTNENFTMMKAFAASADAAKKWYPLWAINFDGSPYELDYRNDDDFVREIPAVFELVEKAYRLYCWTGDRRYIEDEVLWNYYTKAVTDFVTLHDNKFPNGIAEGSGEGNIFKGVATFNEQKDIPLIEAGDGIACQYQACLSYSKMAGLRGEKDIEKKFIQKAEELKTYFNTDWGVKDTDTYNRGYSSERKPVAGWGKENSWFMPMKELLNADSERTGKYLDFIAERMASGDDIPVNIEAISYIPEVFFKYNRNKEGWKWMKHIIATVNEKHAESELTGNNGNYPEVSFVLISNVVEDLAGILPDAADNKISTVSHLPEEIETLEIKNIIFAGRKVSVLHVKNETTHIVYTEGAGKLLWDVGFPGIYEYLFVEGEKIKCSQRNDKGTVYSFCQLELMPEEQKRISVHP